MPSSCVSAASWPRSALIAGFDCAPAAALTPAGELRLAPCDLRAQARAHPRQILDRVGARAHPLRFLRQCLRRLCAAIPAGLGARQWRGQGHAQRPALHDLGGRRRQEVRLQVGELSQPDGWSITWTGEAERQLDKVAVSLTKPIGQEVRSRRRHRFSDRSYAPHHRGGARGQDHPGASRLRWLGKGREGLQHPDASSDARSQPNERVPTDAAAGQQALAGLKRWPVTVSYFDRAAKPAATRRRSIRSSSRSTRTASRAR